MAFQQYPNSIAVVIQTGPDVPLGEQIIHLGTVQPDENQQLEIYRVQLFKRGMQPSVQMFLRAYQGTTLIGTSTTMRVSEIEAKYAATENFYGWIGFTFSPRINCHSGIPTRLDLVLVNYSYASDDSIFIGAVLDWPIQMGYNESPGSVNDAPFALELFGAI